MLAAVSSTLCSVSGPCAGSEFRDPDDGAFDLSEFLLNHRGVLPVPDVITEPAIGYGLGVGLLYFSMPKRSDAEGAHSASEPSAGDTGATGQNATDKGQTESSTGNPKPADAQDGASKTFAPPNITGLGLFGTGTHSWGAGLAHFHTWDDDSIRYLGVIGKVSLHLNYYGFLDNPHSYQLDGIAVVQQVLFRIGDSRWYIGPRYTYFDTATRFGPILPEGIHNYEADERIGKGGLVIDYDTRDNMFYPNRGTYAEFEADVARSGLGSSTDFEMESARAYQWITLAKEWVLGLRFDSGFSQGNIPFFAQPYVSLRGVADAHYQDRNQVTTEAELHWKFTPRWSVLFFGGVGRAYGNVHSFSDAPTAFGVGTGFRYLIARKLGISMGLDVAHGPGQNAIYVQVGSAWR